MKNKLEKEHKIEYFEDGTWEIDLTADPIIVEEDKLAEVIEQIFITASVDGVPN